MTIETSTTTHENSGKRVRTTGMLLGVMAAVLGLLLVACSGGNDAGEVANPDDLQASAVQVEGSDKNLVAKFPTPAKAANLSTNDLKVGEGAAAQAGAVVQSDYWLFLGSTGQLADSSTTHSPGGIDFKLDPQNVIPGFAKGMEGIQAGGERVIVVPPDQGYGSNPPTGIPANETLVFVVKAMKVTNPS